MTYKCFRQNMLSATVFATVLKADLGTCHPKNAGTFTATVLLHTTKSKYLIEGPISKEMS